MKLKTVVQVFVFFALTSLVGASAASCYDTSKLPPCNGNETWPNPCAGAPRDAGQG